MSYISQLDKRAIFLNSLLEARIQANRSRDKETEFKYLQALSQELKKLEADGVTRTYVKTSYEGGAKGKSQRTISHLKEKVKADLEKFSGLETDGKLETKDEKHNATALAPTSKVTIAPPPAYNDQKAVRDYNRFMTKTKQLQITPEDYVRGLDLEQLSSLPPSLVGNPTYATLIKERKVKLERKQKAQEKLLYDKELAAAKKIEASKEELHQDDVEDMYIAPSSLYTREVDYVNPIHMRQFQFDDPNNIPVMAKNLQEKDTLRRATKIKIYDDEPKTYDKAGEKLEQGMRQRLRKPKVKFEPSNEQRQPLQSFQPTNIGDSGLDASMMYELMGFRSDGTRDDNTEATLRYIRDRY